MQDFKSTDRMPVTVELYLSLPTEEPEHNPMFPSELQYDKEFNKRSMPPFKVASAATRQRLIMMYKDECNGWTAVLANTYGRPFFFFVDIPIPDCYLHYHVYTRYYKNQNHDSFETSLSGYIPIRLLPHDMDPTDGAMEMCARVAHKIEHNVHAHVTYPGTMDMDNRAINNKALLQEWQHFNVLISQYSRHLKYMTSRSGIMSYYRQELLDLNAMPQPYQTTVAVLLDYFQDITSKDIFAFLQCCKNRLILVPPPNLALMAFQKKKWNNQHLNAGMQRRQAPCSPPTR